MGKKTYVTQMDYEFNPQLHGTTIEGESETEEGQTVSVEQLFQMHITGQIIAKGDNDYWSADNEDFDQPDVLKESRSDIFDRQSTKEQLENEIQRLTKLQHEKVQQEEIEKKLKEETK